MEPTGVNRRAGRQQMAGETPSGARRTFFATPTATLNRQQGHIADADCARPKKLLLDRNCHTVRCITASCCPGAAADLSRLFGRIRTVRPCSVAVPKKTMPEAIAEHPDARNCWC